LDSWSPQQYHRYGDERQRPAADLLARIPLEAPAVVYDLGCGSGLSTAVLANRWPHAGITGVDSSPAMLAAARKALPGLAFADADISGWSASRAGGSALQQCHAALAGRSPRAVSPADDPGEAGRRLAVQMPRNHGEPSHQAMLAAAEAGPWRERLRPLLRPSPVAPPAAYHALLRPLAAHLDIWETVYLHELSGENPVAEWTKGTALKPLLDALDGEQRRDFEAAYRARVAEAYPPTATGQTLFPFRRLFLIAQRGLDA
jgi:Trans-aconitate methyltransferase